MTGVLRHPISDQVRQRIEAAVCAPGLAPVGVRTLDLRDVQPAVEGMPHALVAWLEHQGFRAVSSRRELTASRWRELRTRHVSVLLADAEPIEWAIDLIRTLAIVSPRVHILIRLASGPTARRPGRSPCVGARDRRAEAALLSAGRARLIAADLDAARAIVAAVTIVADLTGVPLSRAATCFAAEAAFWRGQPGEAVVQLNSHRDGTECAAWLGVLGWSGFDVSALDRGIASCRQWARGGHPRARVWTAILEGLRAPDAVAARRIISDVQRCLVDRAPSDLSLLAPLAAAEGFLASGQPEKALGCLRSQEHRADGLLRLAAAWLAARAGRTGEVTVVRRAIVARDVQGILRWGQGRDVMRMLHFVPGLLQVVHEAEDERVALAEACAWVRVHGGASGVAIVADAGRVVAGAGWPGTELEPCELIDLCRERPGPAGGAADGLVRMAAPVRYGGAVIGHVVAQAAAGSAEQSRDAVEALAALSGPALRARLETSESVADPVTRMPEIVGRGPAIAAVRAAVTEAARTAFPVLIEGESGTGKELVARALHRLSPRASRRFMAINCAAFTDELIEAELFGFARGAFTGAVTARPGLFEEAHGGSLFLDEVGDLSARAQAKLLRTLQEREVRRVGENATRVVDVRLVAATNIPLVDAVADKRFRGDLLFRLAVIRISLPPLRDRQEDLPALATVFWRRAMTDVGKQARLSRDAVAALGAHAWPGNIRELQNVLARLAVQAPRRGRVTARDVRAHLTRPSPVDGAGLPLGDLRRLCERRAVAGALVRHAGRRSAAARELGLSRQGLLKAIRRLGLKEVDDSAGVA